MSHEQNGQSAARPDPEFAEAFKDLLRGEQAAAAMEKNLDALEKRIEELLAKAAEDEQKMNTQKKPETDGEKETAKDENTK